jgi:hypothetical protein
MGKKSKGKFITKNVTLQKQRKEGKKFFGGREETHTSSYNCL